MNNKVMLMAILAGLAACGTDSSSDPAATGDDASGETAQVIRFVLEYDPSKIDERLQYGVRATIRHEGQLLFTSDTHTPVLTRGAGNTADIMLIVVDRDR